MSNYHLIDITFSEIEEKESSNLCIDDIHDDSSEVLVKDRHEIGHWPSFINLRKLERVKIRKFLQSLESDTWSTGRWSRKGSTEKAPTANTIEIPTKEEGLQVRRKSSRCVTLPEDIRQNNKELEEDTKRVDSNKDRFRNFKERFNAGVERVNAWKERVYEDKEHFYVDKEHSRKKHVEGDKESGYTDDSEPSTSAALAATNSALTLTKSEDIDRSDHKTKKAKIVKKDFFRFR